MSLLQILQPIILVHLPCSTDPLHGGAALGAHLRIGHPGDIEGGAHRRGEGRLLVVLLLRLRRWRTMTTEILRLNFGLLICREVFRVLTLPLNAPTSNAAPSSSQSP